VERRREGVGGEELIEEDEKEGRGGVWDDEEGSWSAGGVEGRRSVAGIEEAEVDEEEEEDTVEVAENRWIGGVGRSAGDSFQSDSSTMQNSDPSARAGRGRPPAPTV
jgi:hypothetical protein